jgi:hypothetical protein
VTFDNFVVLMAGELGTLVMWASFIWGISYATDGLLRPDTRLALGQWITQSQPARYPVKWISAYAEMFDRAFAFADPPKLIMPRTIGRSLVLTMTLMVVLLAIHAVGYWTWIQEYSMRVHLSAVRDPTEVARLKDAAYYFAYVIASVQGSHVAGWFIGGLLLNIVFDYVAILETRFCISKIVDAGEWSVRVFWFLVDAVVTICLSMVTLFLAHSIGGITLGEFVRQANDIAGYSALSYNRSETSLEEIVWQFQKAIEYPFVNDVPVLPLSAVVIYTTLATSIWLWLFGLLVVVCRASCRIHWVRDAFVTLFHVEKHPIKTLAWVGIFILVAVTLGKSIFNILIQIVAINAA